MRPVTALQKGIQMSKQKSAAVDMFSLAKSMAEMAEIDTSVAGDLTHVKFDPDMQWVGMGDKEVKAYKAAFDLVATRDKVAIPAMCLAMGQALLNAIADSDLSSGTVELYGERKLTVGFGVAKEGEARAVGISLEEPSAIKTSVGAAIIALERMASGIPTSDDTEDEPTVSDAEETADE